jgi:hypothetical protein
VATLLLLGLAPALLVNSQIVISPVLLDGIHETGSMALSVFLTGTDDMAKDRS